MADQLYPAADFPDRARALAKTQELKAGLVALRDANNALDWAAMRRVANISQARMG